MGQPTNYIYNRLGGMSIKAGTVMTTAQILTKYPTAKVAILQSQTAKISINATDAITFHLGDDEIIVAGKTWAFQTDCEISIAEVVDLAV